MYTCTVRCKLSLHQILHTVYYSYQSTHQMVVDDIDVFQFSISTKYILQIFLRCVETETKYSQYIARIRIELWTVGYS